MCALVFALATWQLVSRGPIRRADERLGVWIYENGALPRSLAEFFSDLGNSTVALPVLVAAVALTSWQARRAGERRWWLPGLAACLAMAAVPALVVPLKEIFDRPGQPSAAGLGYYPSGHTATATVAYGACVLLILARLRTGRDDGAHGARRGLVALCAGVSLCVGFGLVRQGYHWPLDVVASWCLAAALLQVLSLVLVRTGGGEWRREAP